MTEDKNRKSLEEKIKNIFNKLPKGEKIKNQHQERLRNQLRKFTLTTWQINTINSIALIYLDDFPSKIPPEIIKEFNDNKNDDIKEKKSDDASINQIELRLFNYHDPITDENINKTLLELDRYNDRETFVKGRMFYTTKKTGKLPKSTIFDLLKMKQIFEDKLGEKSKEIFDFNREINSLHLVMHLVYLEAFIYESLKIILYYDYPRVSDIYDKLPIWINHKNIGKKKADILIEYYIRNSSLSNKIKIIDKELDIYLGLFEGEYKFLEYINLIRNIIVHKGGLIDRQFMSQYKTIKLIPSLQFPKHTNKEIGSFIPVSDNLVNELRCLVNTITGYMTLNIMKKYLGFEGIADEFKVRVNPVKKEIVDKLNKK